MNLSKEEQIVYSHFDDMYKMAHKRGIPIYSDFAGLNEIGIMYRLLLDKHVPPDLNNNYVVLYGGYEQAERRMICFLPDYYYGEIDKIEFPIACVKIEPVNRKFCDSLNHRDFLGTVMNVGLTRSQIGDIIVKKEEYNGNASYAGYVFCKNNKAELLTDITRVKHTTVYAQITDCRKILFEQEYKEISGNVPSLRLDAIIAAAIRLSRSKCLALIRGGSVYLNGRCCMESAEIVNSNDIISIRGYGKYMIGEVSSLTRKGRFNITVRQYI